MANRIIVFDIGGTLMEFDGMPLNWSEYYQLRFKRLAESLGCSIADGEILRSAEIFRSYNPRFHEREKEIKPDVIFSECLKGWNCNYEVQKAANLFFEGLELKPRIYDGAIKLIAQLKKKGCTVGLYTDLPCGMPDCWARNCPTKSPGGVNVTARKSQNCTGRWIPSWQTRSIWNSVRGNSHSACTVSWIGRMTPCFGCPLISRNGCPAG